MDDDYSLVMPFVVCASNDGPYDDDAYVAGYEAGRIDAQLSSRRWEQPLLVTVRRDNLPQIDLIAMRHRCVVTEVPWGDDVDRATAAEWVSAEITHQEA